MITHSASSFLAFAPVASNTPATTASSPALTCRRRGRLLGLLLVLSDLNFKLILQPFFVSVRLACLTVCLLFHIFSIHQGFEKLKTEICGLPAISKEIGHRKST